MTGKSNKYNNVAIDKFIVCGFGLGSFNDGRKDIYSHRISTIGRVANIYDDERKSGKLLETWERAEK